MQAPSDPFRSLDHAELDAFLDPGGRARSLPDDILVTRHTPAKP
jgi:hypothetical protein